ncbi:hypothetical protein [Streptomyces sp. NBC_00122]|uniref:cucumopine synthase-related protein n=1 Tax=Streptomyces sp. NBC_00122 TaxID=2903623 RepID=UPI0032435DAD
MPIDSLRHMARLLVGVPAEFLGYCGLEKLWYFTQRSGCARHPPPARPSATWCSASCPGPTRRVSPPLAAPVVQPSLRRIHCTLSFIRLYKRSQSASQLLHGFGDFPPRGLADVLALFRIDSM